ncbi:hypothetical protein VAA_02317 [Vibrio anguillarum 775]|nr:hypothetical protein VAA_02317 [Vibrio anguillarum 775]
MIGSRHNKSVEHKMNVGVRENLAPTFSITTFQREP